MRGFHFKRPKGPGFGISKNFYLSVLSPKPVLPPITHLVNPSGERGAVEGFGVPLGGTSSDKSVLNQPMTRGLYVVTTKDRKTVIRMTIIPRDEAGFDPEALLQSPLAAEMQPDMAARIRATWTLAQFNFEAHDPDVYPSLDFLESLVVRFGLLVEGVVADPVSQRYLLPSEIVIADRINPRVDAREHVRVHARSTDKSLHVYTLGLQKFALPELELIDVPSSLLGPAEVLLLGVAQQMLEGKSLRNGDRAGLQKPAFEIRDGGLDRAFWQGLACYELIPVAGFTVESALQS